MRENIPNERRKIRATKPKATGPFTKGSGRDFTPGRGYDFGLETRREESPYGPEYRTYEREEERRYIPKVSRKPYGLPCAGCGISRPLAAREGEECEYCGTVYADTKGARIYIEG